MYGACLAIPNRNFALRWWWVAADSRLVGEDGIATYNVVAVAEIALPNALSPAKGGFCFTAGDLPRKT